MNNEVIHDFRPNKLKWGWNGLNFSVCPDNKTAIMTGIGDDKGRALFSNKAREYRLRLLCFRNKI